MSEFNLEEFKAGRNAITRDGREVEFRYYCNDCVDRAKIYTKVKGHDELTNFFDNGRFLFEGEHYFDLVAMAPKTVTKYINVYKDEEDYLSGEVLYDSPGEAIAHGGSDVFATIHVTWEE